MHLHVTDGEAVLSHCVRSKQVQGCTHPRAEIRIIQLSSKPSWSSSSPAMSGWIIVTQISLSVLLCSFIADHSSSRRGDRSANETKRNDRSDYLFIFCERGKTSDNVQQCSDTPITQKERERERERERGG